MERRYFNFPIQLLEGFFDNSKKVLDNILDYAIFSYSEISEYDNSTDSQIKCASEFYRVTLGNSMKSYDNGEMLYNSIPPKSPKVGLNVDIFFDYYKNDKTDFQKACLLGFLGIKSILMNKSYHKMDNLFWLARMDGKSKSIKSISELSKKLQHFGSHYQTRKIKKELKENWNLKTYSYYTRGFYVSFKLDLEELIFQAEKQRKSTKEKQNKAKEKEARIKAIKRLENEENHNL